MSLKFTRRDFITSTGKTAAAGAMQWVCPELMAAEALAPQSSTNGLIVTDLRVDYASLPMVLENPQPLLSWRLESNRRGARQTAYRVLVASSEALLAQGQGDLWDSGRVVSSDCFSIPYKGVPLISRQRCCWRVQVWDDLSASNESRPDLSAPAKWEMGLLNPSDWSAQWIAAETLDERGDRAAGLKWIAGPSSDTPRKFRFTFDLAEEGNAKLIVIASGPMSVWLDGVPLTLPVHDKKAFGAAPAAALPLRLPKGHHVLAVAISKPPRSAFGGAVNTAANTDTQLAAMLRVKFANGSTQRFSTSGWKTSLSETAGWESPQYDDASWPIAATGTNKNEPWPAEPAVLLRRPFNTSKAVQSARLYATALGAYEAHINGQRVGDSQLTAESTDFRKRVLYEAYDVTHMITQGENVLGAMVGDGFYASYLAPGGRYAFGPAPRRLLAQLELTYTDGTREVISTDKNWTSGAAPITISEIYNGEDYDARLEQPGWAKSGFASASWYAAAIAAAPSGQLVGQVSPPVRRKMVLSARSITQIRPGVFIFDFGQNFAGWCRLKVKGTAGQTVALRFAEILKADGDIDQSNLRAARAADLYTLRGDPAGETYEPHFTYHGFRYVQVTGYPGVPTASDLEGQVVFSDLRETGTLRIDNPVIQKLWQNTVWSQRSNFVGLPTDCPQRDERLGWMGDANVFWDAAAFNMDIATFTRRFMGDVRDAQTSDGAFPFVTPYTSTPVAGRGSAPGWADAGVVLPWTSWKRYGDTGVIDKNWDAMTRYLGFILEANPDHVWRNKRSADFGDWLALDAKAPGDPTTPKDLIGTATWTHSTDCMIEMAEATGRDAEAAQYRALRAHIETAFQSNFVQADGTVGNGSQTGYILSLRYQLVPPTLRKAAADKLVADIKRRGTLLSTGFLGTPSSLDALADAGHDALVYDLLLRTEFPSWGYMVAKGATTIWERWSGDTGDTAMNSFNHYGLGAISGFLYRRIVGMEPLLAGFRKFEVKPVLDGRVKSAGADYDSVLGRISVKWRQEPGGIFILELVVPPNASANVYLPAKKGMQVREGRSAVTARTTAKLVNRNDAVAVVEVSSGSYRFEVRR